MTILSRLYYLVSIFLLGGTNVEAHHRVNGPDTRSNSEGRRTKKLRNIILKATFQEVVFATTAWLPFQKVT